MIHKGIILVVDDEDYIRSTIAGILTDEHYDVKLAKDGYEAMEVIKNYEPQIVLLDIWMPGIDGVEMLKKIKEQTPDTIVIMISGHGTIDTAVKTIKIGAFDFIEKPLSADKLLITIENGLKFYNLERENRQLRGKVEKKYELIGVSKSIKDLRRKIAIVAQTDSWVLITGENGTGKELVARSIHRMSKRTDMPFVDVNCAAIPDELLESELFGYEKGSFTGADRRRIGKIELADKGTIFLDEVGDMSLKMQAKLLRTLEEGRFERIGGNDSINVDIRVITATNKTLQNEIEEGRFREDLYYRLNVIPIHVSPLRERKDDIPVLINYFLKDLCDISRNEKTITDEAMDVLTQYRWNGNVRELKNLLERLFVLTEADTIDVDDIPAEIKNNKEENTAAANLQSARTSFEREYIIRMLKEHNWNITKTAAKIGISRENLSRKIKYLGIAKED
ncbi:MAG: sigma-54 dependent transcriptional regulator [Deltaproteobacteria bacterium]|nr:sigma-54 dependent transcriptional regulator [Deltaproteobacteria bacterium]MCL5792542.1 sigma-54 dependent transcriptional regulator [Deltaproteobacteria bacterium]